MLSYIYASLGHCKRKLSEFRCYKILSKIDIVNIVYCQFHTLEMYYSLIETFFSSIIPGGSQLRFCQPIFLLNLIPLFEESDLLKKLS